MKTVSVLKAIKTTAAKTVFSAMAFSVFFGMLTDTVSGQTWQNTLESHSDSFETFDNLQYRHGTQPGSNVGTDNRLDGIPENLSEWTERGMVLSTDPSISWEEQNQIAVAGAAKVGDTYYLFYLAGFDGCWNQHGDCNHQSVGLATSTDGVNFTKYSGNPVLIPHDFLPVEAEEEGIRTGYVSYLPSLNQFYGYFGVESPGGSGGCPFGGGSGCGCNIGVDAAVFLATSFNGTDWTVEGQVSGTNAQSGYEVYASGWVFDGTDFSLYVTTAEGGYNKSVSKGADPLNLTYLGGVSVLNFGWAGVDAFLHDDNNTVTLMYEPSGGGHPGCDNDNLYFATTHLDDLQTIENERVITDSGHERNIIFIDGAEWKWYYSDEADEYNNAIELRTHPVNHTGTPLYGLYETTIDYHALMGYAHGYSDPFYGVELEATFTAPSGRQVIWWGFFDGDGNGGQTGNIWKLRFMPDELGDWTFIWNLSDGSLSGNGLFTVVDNTLNPRKPGPLKHDPNIHQWLVTADSSRHLFLNGYDNGLIPGDGQSQINSAVENGFEVLMPNGPSGSSSAWVDQTDYIPRMDTWHSVENDLFQALYDNDMYFYDWSGFYGGNGWLNLHTKPTAFQDKVVKYSVVRTAPYFFYLYNIGFELQEYVDVPSWPVARAQYVRSIDPWDHLITGHELNNLFSYGDEPIMGFSAMQLSHTQNYHAWALTVWNSSAQPHPHVDEGLWDYSGPGPSSETAFRKLVWESLTGGMSFHLYIGSSGSGAQRGLTSSRHLNAFMKNGVKWWTMSPHDEVVVSGTAYSLAKLGEEYIVYSYSGTDFSLDLPAGDYTWRWFNPANGVYGDNESLSEYGGGSVEFIKPDTNDWVLHIASTVSNITPLTDVVITLVGDDIELSWEDAGAIIYHIYRSSDPYAADWGEAIGSSDVNSYTDIGILTLETKCFYYVTVSD